MYFLGLQKKQGREQQGVARWVKERAAGGGRRVLLMQGLAGEKQAISRWLECCSQPRCQGKGTQRRPTHNWLVEVE